MKLLGINLLILISMTQKKHFEHLLGEPISLIRENYSYSREINSNKTSSFIAGNFNFFETPIDYGFHVSLDENNLIDTILFSIPYVIDKLNYVKMMDRYGIPNEISKKDKVTTFEPVTSNGITAIESIYTVKECTFDEQPMFIIWHKNSFTLKIIIEHERNISKIEYRKT